MLVGSASMAILSVRSGCADLGPSPPCSVPGALDGPQPATSASRRTRGANREATNGIQLPSQAVSENRRRYQTPVYLVRTRQRVEIRSRREGGRTRLWIEWPRFLARTGG